MIRVLIVDDIKILCNGLNAALKQDSDIEVVGMVYDGRQAIEACGSLKPDVVLMDMRMPEYDGAYATKKIKEKYQEIKVLILTTFDDTDTVQKALASGADGYILKEAEDEKIISSIKSVYHGVTVLGNSVFQQVKKSVKELKSSIPDHLNITKRECEMLSYIAKGYNNREIATKLHLAEGTVRNNISRLLEKLKLKDRTQLAVYAVKNGID